MIKTKLNIKELTYNQLDERYLDDLLTMQNEVFATIENTELLRENSMTTLKDCLINHFTLGVFDQEQLIAFGILFFGSKTHENIGYDLDINKDSIDDVANIKLIIVKDDYRGNSLQTIIIDQLEVKAKQLNFKILGATVSPHNIYSINNFLACNFLFYKQTIKYNGLIRNVYYKKIET